MRYVMAWLTTKFTLKRYSKETLYRKLQSLEREERNRLLIELGEFLQFDNIHTALAGFALRHE